MEAISNVQSTPPVVNSDPTPAPQPVKFLSGKLEQTEEAAESKKPKEKKSKVDVNKMVKAYNQFVQTVGTKLSFVKDDASGRMVILVKDQTTGKVIRQIPSKEMLELLAKMKNLEGMLFNGES